MHLQIGQIISIEKMIFRSQTQMMLVLTSVAFSQYLKTQLFLDKNISVCLRVYHSITLFFVLTTFFMLFFSQSSSKIIFYLLCHFRYFMFIWQGLKGLLFFACMVVVIAGRCTLFTQLFLWFCFSSCIYKVQSHISLQVLFQMSFRS